MGKFSNVSALQINRKLNGDSGFFTLNPFAWKVEDSLLAALSSAVRNTLYFNRTGTVFSGELGIQESKNKAILTYGPESRSKREISMRYRWAIKTKVTFFLDLSRSRQSSSSAGLSNRNYSFNSWEGEPKLAFQQGTVSRVTFGYKYGTGLNDAALGGERSVINEGSLECRYSAAGKSTLNFKLAISAIEFNGNAQSTLAYSMLSGLQPGTNYLWNFSYEKKLAGNIHMGFNYDGKKPGELKTVHVGRVSARAIF